jgi:hypothetical protein
MPNTSEVNATEQPSKGWGLFLATSGYFNMAIDMVVEGNRNRSRIRTLSTARR